MISGMCAECYAEFRRMLDTVLTASNTPVEVEVHDACAEVAVEFLQFIGAKPA